MSKLTLAERKARPHRFDATLQGHMVTIAYRGTEFFGFQRQPAHRTVQECLEVALEKIWGTKIIVQGSGRTDTGVHGLGQIASFNAPHRHTPPHLQRALNANLPRDMRVIRCRLVSPAFHARFDATGKTYRYLIWNHPVQDPFTLDTHWHIPRPLDLPAMRRAVRALLGEHDFASFTSNPGYERETTVRTMRRITVNRHGSELSLTFTADGFLYRMVRNLVGALVKVGLGRITPEAFGQILESKRRSDAPNTAPASGLYLVRVEYPAAKTRSITVRAVRSAPAPLLPADS